MDNALHRITDHLHSTDECGSERWQEWKKERQLKAYSEHAPARLGYGYTTPTRPRALTFTKDGFPQRPGASSDSKSRLLSLLAEIRILIWEYTFGGNLIAIYLHKKRRVAHGLVDETNSQITQEDLPFHIDSIRTAVDLPSTTDGNSKRPTRSNRLGVLAALRTCRTMSAKS
jgi:hypothetical protein